MDPHLVLSSPRVPGCRGIALRTLIATCCLVLCATPARPENIVAHLRDGRFEVRVAWSDPQGVSSPALVSSVVDQSAVFHFFDDDNPELLVKVLDGRPLNGHFWVFYGAVTTLAMEVRVRDTSTGEERVYEKADGLPLGGADTEAFSDAGVPVLAPARRPAEAATKAGGACGADAGSLCLQDGRFRVRAAWRADPASSAESFAGAVPTSDQSGYLWFFDQGNAEVLVKVLDGRPVNGAYWVLFGSATSVPFELRVTDLETGVERTFTADAFAGGADAFTFGARADLPVAPAAAAPYGEAPISPYEPALVAIDSRPGHGCLDYSVDEQRTGEAADWSEVWTARCVDGVLRTAPSLGIGTFYGEQATFGLLRPDTMHRLRTRRRVEGAAGDIAGPWSEHSFVTGPSDAAYRAAASTLADPRWTVGGADVRLPDTSCRLRLLAGARRTGTELATFRSPAASSPARALVSAPAFDGSVAGQPLRAVIDECVARLALAPSEVRWRTLDGRTQTIFLPAVDVLLGQTREFEVAEGGSVTSPEPLRDDDPRLDPGLLLRHSDSPWQTAPDLRVDRVATDRGFSLPVNLVAGGPNLPFLYVTELYGAIRTVAGDGSVGTYAEGLLDFDPTAVLPGGGEMGLAGTLVEPATGDLLVSTAYRSGTAPDGSVLISGRVLRLESDDAGRTAARVRTVFDLGTETRLSRAHQISHLDLGPDGMLYVHVGDGFVPGAAQDLDDYRGKILRMGLDGSAPADNPFYDAGDGIGVADYVWARGLRNPFGGDWRAADGRYYAIEPGPSVDRMARIRRGGNYGWGAGGEGTNEQMATGAVFNWPRAVTPFDLVFVSGAVDSPALPDEWEGRALVAEFGFTYRFGRSPLGKRLALFDLDADGRPRTGPATLLRYAGLGPATIAATTVVTGTADRDGLYFLDFFPDHVDQAPEPTAPEARLWRLSADPAAESTAESEFSADASFLVTKGAETIRE